MNEEETKHFLEILIENDLAFILKILTEGNLTPEEINKAQLREIIKFMNKLPKEYKTLKIERKWQILKLLQKNW